MEMSDDHVTKVAEGSSSDIISDLPSSILECILSFLPLQDVVRTSVLSTKWKDGWSALPHLVFNAEAFNANFPIAKEQDSTLKVTKIIDKILLQHTGPILHFTLSIEYMKSCSDINHWIKFISSHGVENFTLELWTSQPHQLPSRFFSLQQLKILTLLNCEVYRPPSFNGFKRLTSIKFTKVTLSADLLECFISSCPPLKDLFLSYLVSLDTLSINAPKLRLFHSMGEIKSVCFKHTPCLNKGLLHLLRVAESAGHILPTNSCNLVNVFGCQSGTIEVLRFNYCTLKVSPSLSVDLEQAAMFWKDQDYLSYPFNKLQTIHMIEISGIKSEMEFIKLVLANSLVLEKAIFKPNGKDPSNKRFETIKDLTRFSRASSRAEIIYLDGQKNSEPILTLYGDRNRLGNIISVIILSILLLLLVLLGFFRDTHVSLKIHIRVSKPFTFL